MNALFTFTIGPVKSLIENSRKVNDLYAGSNMLSALMKSGIEYLKKRNIEIIIPFTGEEQELSIPNRLVANILNFTFVEGEALGNGLSKHVKEYFKCICNDIFTTCDIVPNENAWEQLNGFLEVYWCFQEYEADAGKESYKKTYKNMILSLQSIKSIRLFHQTNEPWGRKCSLYPEYNGIFAKIQNNNYPKYINKCNAINIANKSIFYSKIKERETLSAIAFVKRMYKGTNNSVDSLNLMILKDCFRKIRELNKALPIIKIEELNTPIANAFYDLYNHNPPDFSEYSLSQYKDTDNILKIVKNNKFTSYYALLKFDGDNMGDEFANRNKDEQKELSKKISEFAQQARKLINKMGGICVYAGGEDFLGFLPLSVLFQTLLDLRVEFIKYLNLTFSAGIAVAHWMQPLKEVLVKANEMEHAAKINGKNSFAVGIIKRSGDFRNICFAFDDQNEIVTTLIKIINFFVNKGYSKSFIQNISATLEKFAINNDGEFAASSDFDVDDMLNVLITYAVKHADINDSELLISSLMELKNKGTLNHFLNTWDVISFMAKEVSL